MARNQYGENCRPLKPERMFRAGQLVRFVPPAGAYHPNSEQFLQRGQSCLVIRTWNDSQATVTFGEGRPILVNMDYLVGE